MAINKITKSFISIIVLVFIILTFIVFFGGYAYELKWQLKNIPNKILISKNKKQIKPKQIDFRPYMAEIQNRLKKTWIPPIKNEDLKVDVEFNVAKNGEIKNIKIINPSKNKRNNDAIITALKKASPLPALPKAYDAENILIKYTFEIKAKE